MTTFKDYLAGRNKTKSQKGEIVEELKKFEYPAFVLLMWNTEYDPPEHIKSDAHQKAIVRLKWEAEKAGIDIEGEVKKLGIENDEDQKWWASAGAEQREWDAADPKNAETAKTKPTKEEKKTAAKAVAKDLPNTIPASFLGYPLMVAEMIGLEF